MTDWNDAPSELHDEESEGDPGFIGGGGMADVIEGDDETLDEHGENLASADEDEL